MITTRFSATRAGYKTRLTNPLTTAPRFCGAPCCFEVDHDIAPELVAAGYVGVMSDFEGLGTPGIHPYLVGPSEGRGVLDIIKAAQQIEQSGAGSRVVNWGRSQGGHAALFAGEIAPTWAPELEVMGVISAAPGSEFQAVITSGVLLPGARGFIWQLSLGFEASYSELSIEDVYTDEALSAIEALLEEEACGQEFGQVAAGFEGAGFETSPLNLPAWVERLLDPSPLCRRARGYVLRRVGSKTMPRSLARASASARGF